MNDEQPRDAKPERRPRGVTLDDLDRRIIEVLTRDGRAQSTAIGEELGISGNLVANRIRAMDAADLMRVVAIADFRVHGYKLSARLRIKVRGRAPYDVAADLAQRDGVMAVHLTSGNYAIGCFFAFESAERMLRAEREITQIPGVVGMEMELMNNVYRYVPGIGPIGLEP